MNKYQRSLRSLRMLEREYMFKTTNQVAPQIWSDTLQELIEKYSKILDDVHNYRYETHCMKMTIRNLCEHFGVKNEKELQNIYLCKPYKFEDLKEEMIVFDNKDKILIRIFTIYKNGFTYDYFGTEQIFGVEFEENRFFPLYKANEVIEND